jgi:hypothetical protein
MSTVEINTAEFEADDVVIATQPAGNTVVEISTDPLTRDPLDGVPSSTGRVIPTKISTYPPQFRDKKAAADRKERPEELKEESEEEEEEQEQEDEEEEQSEHEQPEAETEKVAAGSVAHTLKLNPGFAAEMKTTVPVSTAPEEQETTKPTDKKPKLKQPAKKPIPTATATRRPRRPAFRTAPAATSSAPRNPMFSSRRRGEGIATYEAEMGQPPFEEEQEEAGETPDTPPNLSPDEEYIQKMRLMDEIKDFAKMGAMPPQPPNFGMPVDLLTKIRDYQASIIDETVGIGFIGMGWVGVIGMIESLNEKFDPFARAFGVGLKLNGAKDEVEKNIHLYESAFRHIYRKLPKNKEVGPWAQLVIFTVQILTSVHRSNQAKEARQAAAGQRKPDDAPDPPEKNRTPTAEVPAQPPAPKIIVAEPEQRPITSVDSIVVSPVHSEDEREDSGDGDEDEKDTIISATREKEQQDSEGDLEEDREEGDDEDDVVVHLPLKRGGSKK